MAIAKVSMFAITAPCTADIGYLSKEENFANARLIAAAPDLLDALKAARDVLVAFQKQASYVPLQGYAATMTDAERRCAQAVSDIDSILQTADPRP